MTIRIRTWGGIGDVLLTTPSFRAIKREHPGATLKVYCSLPMHFELLQHNPYIDALKNSPQWCPGGTHFLTQAVSAFVESTPTNYVRLRKFWRRVRVEVPAYSSLLPIVTRRHAVELIGEMLQVTPSDRRLDIFLTADEERRGSERMSAYYAPIVVQTTSISSQNKSWPIDKWRQLVTRNPHYTFVQVGAREDAVIDGVVDLRGATTIRECIALLKFARAFVGVESGLAHAASAVGTPAVVLFGPTSPDVWAHSSNAVVSAGARCAPCIDLLLDSPCPYGTACMSAITIEMVEQALQRQLAVVAQRAAQLTE